MPSSWTASLRYEKQFTGENINTWGDRLNNAFDRIDYSVAGWLTKSISGDYTLTTANDAADEARAAHIKFTGSPVANCAITIPPVPKSYFVWNATAKILTFTTGAGATVSVDAGDKTWISCDGGGVHTITFGGYDLKTYIASIALSAVDLPAQAGNAGKFIRTDGASATWQFVQGSDLNNWTANVAAIWAGTSLTLAMTPGDTYDALEEVTLTSSGNSVALDFGAMKNAHHVLTENTTLANPTNAKVGQTGFIRVTQHASSAKTCTTGTNWYRVGGKLPVSTTLSSENIYQYKVITPTFILFDLFRNPTNT